MLLIDVLVDIKRKHQKLPWQLMMLRVWGHTAAGSTPGTLAARRIFGTAGSTRTTPAAGASGTWPRLSQSLTANRAIVSYRTFP